MIESDLRNSKKLPNNYNEYLYERAEAFLPVHLKGEVFFVTGIIESTNKVVVGWRALAPPGMPQLKKPLPTPPFTLKFTE